MSRLCLPRPIRPLGPSLPSSGFRGRPLREPCGSPRIPFYRTFLGTMGYYDCSRSVRTPLVDPWGHVPPLMGRRSRALFGSWTPCGNMPRLGTPATPARPRNSGRCRILPSACSDTSASQRWTISGLILTACCLAVYASHPPVARRMARLATDLSARL